MILQVIKKENKTIYKGYGYIYEEEKFIDVLGNEQIIHKTEGGNLIHLIYIPQEKQPLAIKIMNIPITVDLMDLFNKEYNDAKMFIDEYQTLKINS